MGFIDTMRSAGQAVESVCRVLPEQGCQVVFHTGPYRTIADVEYATAGWVDWSRYAGDPLSARSWRSGRVAASIGERPWPSCHVCFAPLARVAVS